MKTKILILVVSVILVLSAGMAVYSYASAGSNSAALKNGNGPQKWKSITPVWNGTLQMWVANVSGWGEISVFLSTGGGGGVVFANSLNGLGLLRSYTGDQVGGCLGTGNTGYTFYQAGECGLNTIGARVLTTVVQGELVGVETSSSSTVSIYASVGSIVSG
jgi:hypothetical protein